MIGEELLEKIDEIDSKLNEYFGEVTRRERIFQDSIKLSEEVGELSGEILTQFGKQRKEKLDTILDDNLKYEFADVILTTLILAKSMDVDINEAIELKLKKIDDRGGL